MRAIMKKEKAMKLKKILSVMLSCCFLIGFSIYAGAEGLAFEETNASLYIDNGLVEFDNKPMTWDNGMWLPLIEICDYLNYEVQIDAENIVQIIPGEECKNSDGIADKIVFEIESEEIKMYSGEYENDISNVYTNIDDIYSPMSYQVNEEIYMPAYYMCRAFALKLAPYTDSEPKEIRIFTQNYLKLMREQAEPAVVVRRNLEISIDGQKLDFQSKPFLDENGRTLVPVRELCEFLNRRVYWFDSPQRVCVSNVPPDLDTANGGSAGGDSIWFVIGEKQYRINGDYYDMDTAAQIIDNRTYVPLRVLAEFLGYRVIYAPVSGS